MKLGVFCNGNSSVKWHIVPCKIGGVCAKLFVFDFVKVVLRNFSLTTLGYWKKKKQNKTEKKKRKKYDLNEKARFLYAWMIIFVKCFLIYKCKSPN